jgi:hypothetical protein
MPDALKCLCRSHGRLGHVSASREKRHGNLGLPASSRIERPACHVTKPSIAAAVA